GLGLITGTAGVTLDKVAERVKLYRDALKTAEPISRKPKEYVSLTLLGCCDEDAATARRKSEEAFIDYYRAATVVYSGTVNRIDSGVDFSKIGAHYTFEGLS